jgi:hypothetical protein
LVKLVVPFVGELQTEDSRLIRLAEHLGISVQTLALPQNIRQHGQYLESTVPDSHSCIVVNPKVMLRWVGGNALPEDLIACLTSRFEHVIVHSLRPQAFDANTVAALSKGRFQSVGPIGAADQYEIDRNSQDICGPFAGLTFGPANSTNDCVLSGTGDSHGVRQLISIGGRPFMAGVRWATSEVLFLASQDVADLDAEVGDTPLSAYFSGLVPHAMALRRVFGEESWRPSGQHAAVIIDDPLLRDSYGFLNFESLRRLMKRHRFHTTIAFIPHNYRRSSPSTTRMFRENTGNFGICFHGNDHTGAELASTDSARLNTMLQIAEDRMHVHGEITGLECDKVMVFPQGKFSIEAMRVLKSRNFHAAVNTVSHPAGQPVRLTIGELAQPAVLRYGGFPLFLRKPIQRTARPDIAFSLFFGRPVLIVEHHDVFQRPDSLAEVADSINSLAPEIHWSNLATAVDSSTLTRRSPDGVQHVRAYSAAARIHNHSSFSQRVSVEWSHAAHYPRVEQVLQNDASVPCFEVNDREIRVSVEMAAGDSQAFAVTYRNEQPIKAGLGFRWTVKAFLRRRLSEIRDNHLSKNPRVLAAAKTLQRRFALAR